MVSSFNSSFILSKIKTFASTAIPTVRIIPAIPGNVKVASNKVKTPKRINNAEKQTYQQEIINRFFSPIIANSVLNNTLEFVYGIQSYVYLLNFVFEHNPNLVTKLQEPVIENKTERMLLANHSLQQLNILDDNHYKGKLSSVSNLLNNCITPMGSRSFKHNILNPTTCREKIPI